MRAPESKRAHPSNLGSAGIYIHVPFCKRKCAYCDFASYTDLEFLFSTYTEAICAEIEREASSWEMVCFDTVFIGGGTPTLFPAPMIVTLINHCRRYLTVTPNAEITIEANPGTISPADLRTLRLAGINRLSLGVQSLHDDELRLLGRIHTAQEALEAFRLAREAGFPNINLDLIYGLPSQTLGRWRETLENVIALRPEHLSLYALTLEEGTPLIERVEAGELPAPDDDLAADMYEAAEALLAHAGYTHYEISNWARRSTQDREGEIPALACQHNLKYWRNERYLGLGAAAYSFDGWRRYANSRDPAGYVARITSRQAGKTESEELTSEGRMGETMMLGLRLMVGVSWDEFAQRYGIGLAEVYGREIDELVDAGLLQRDDRGVRLTPRGRLLGNQVFAAFLR